MPKEEYPVAPFDEFRKIYTAAAEPAFGEDSRFFSDGLTVMLYGIYIRLAECSKKFNLTAITEVSAVVEKHLIDSLMLIPRLEEEGALTDGTLILDIGAGAGFPSLPLAAASASGGFPPFKVTAIDSTAKKIGYIKDTAALLGIGSIRAETGRAEELARTGLRGKFDVVTARAVSAMPVLIELAAPFVKRGGAVAAMKSHSEDEVKSAEKGASVLGLDGARVKTYSLPSGDARSVVIYRKTGSTPPEYPREYSKIIKKPL